MAQELEEKKKKKVFYHFYYPDLHIYINIWRFCKEKVEAEQLKQKSVVLLMSTTTSPV